MTAFELLEQIYILAQKRKWIYNSNFIIYHDNIFSIDRTGLNKYKDAYKKFGKYSAIDLAYNNATPLSKVDTWLIECIRTYIPEAKKYKFLLYTPNQYIVNYSYLPTIC
jgi:hypothetical protein